MLLRYHHHRISWPDLARMRSTAPPPPRSSSRLRPAPAPVLPRLRPGPAPVFAQLLLPSCPASAQVLLPSCPASAQLLLPSSPSSCSRLAPPAFSASALNLRLLARARRPVPTGHDSIGSLEQTEVGEANLGNFFQPRSVDSWAWTAMERQTSFRLGALEKLKSFRGLDNFRGKSKDSPGKRGDTALHLAARAGSVPHVQRILAEFDRDLVGELAARPNQDGETALYVAAEKGHTEVVREILKVSDVQTAGIKASNSFDAFHIAAKQGHLDVLKELLQAFPALAMTTNSVNATALETAAIQGHIDIVNLLLETDASLAKIARNNGKTVLHSAARMGHVEVVRSLLNKDPGIGLRKDKKGQTALHMASKGTNAEIVVELLKPDVSVSHIEDNKGNRPLHVATRKGNIIIVQTLLLVEGIDVNAVNSSGQTALAIAEKENNEELVNILRDAGGVTTKEQVHPANPARQLKQTVSDIRHDVQSQIKQTRQTKMQVQKIKSRLEKLHIGGLNNAINSNTVVAVLIATVAFAAIFTVPGNFLEDLSQAPPGSDMSLGQAYAASNPAFILFLVFDSLALFISLAVVVVQTSLIVVEQKAKKRMVFVMNKLMWLACLFISAAFIALTYVVVGRGDWWLAWCTMAIGAVIMLTTLGSMCYCIVAHRMEEKNMRKIRKASASQSRSWSMPVDSDIDPEAMMNTEYKKMYAL